MLSIESVRQIVQMGHAEDLDFQLQQVANNLSGDFRTLSLVGRSERFIQEKNAARSHTVDNRAHSAEFFVQLSTFHAGVFFTLEVCEHAVADIGAK